MPGNRGVSEEQIKAFDREEELSQKMAELGINHFYVSTNPLEGTQVTGSNSKTAKWLQELLTVNGYDLKVQEDEMIFGGKLDRYGSRKQKRELLKRGFRTALPPLPMAMDKIRTFELYRVIFAKMINELTRINPIKWGCELPKEFESWFDEDDKDLFPHLRGQNYTSQLPKMTAARGFRSTSEFYLKMIRRCYETLAGPMALQKFHMNQEMEEIEDMLEGILRNEPEQDIEEERMMQHAHSIRNQEEHEREEEQWQRKEEEQRQRDEKEQRQREEQRQQDEQEQRQREEQEAQEEQQQRYEEMRRDLKIQDNDRDKRQREESQERERERMRREVRLNTMRERRRSGEENVPLAPGVREALSFSQEPLAVRAVRDRERSRSQEECERNLYLQEGSSKSYAPEQWSSMMKPGLLLDLHKDAQAQGPRSHLQLVKRKLAGEEVIGVTMSDSMFMSHDVIPGNKAVAQLLASLPLYSLVELLQVSVHKDKLLLHSITGPSECVLPPTQLVCGPGLDRVEPLSRQSLTSWGEKFREDIDVNLHAGRKEVNKSKIVNQIQQQKSSAKARKGTTDTSVPVPAPSSARHIRNPFSCPHCVFKNFPDAKTLKLHMENTHF